MYCLRKIVGNLKSRQLRWAGYVARMQESRNAYIVLMGKSEGKKLLMRPSRWEDNIKIDLKMWVVMSGPRLTLFKIGINCELT